MTYTLSRIAVLAATVIGANMLAPAIAGADSGPPAPAERTAPKSCGEALQALSKANKALKRAKQSGDKQAIKRAKRKRGAAKLAVLVYCDEDPGGDTGGDTGGGTVGPAPAVPGGPTWSGGRYQGTYAQNSVDLAFNVNGTRLYTGPFDAFYVDSTCRESDPDYTGPNAVYTDSWAIEPVQATVSGDGTFSGSGVFVPSPGVQVPWTLTGRISGKSITDARLSVSYTDHTGDPCSGVADFTANWYGDYEL